MHTALALAAHSCISPGSATFSPMCHLRALWQWPSAGAKQRDQSMMQTFKIHLDRDWQLQRARIP